MDFSSPLEIALKRGGVVCSRSVVALLGAIDAFHLYLGRVVPAAARAGQAFSVNTDGSLELSGGCLSRSAARQPSALASAPYSRSRTFTQSYISRAELGQIPSLLG